MRIDSNHNRIFLKDQTQKKRKNKTNKHTKTSPPPSPLTKPSALRHVLYPSVVKSQVLDKGVHISVYRDTVFIIFFLFSPPSFGRLTTLAFCHAAGRIILSSVVCEAMTLCAPELLLFTRGVRPGMPACRVCYI